MKTFNLTIVCLLLSNSIFAADDFTKAMGIEKQKMIAYLEKANCVMATGTYLDKEQTIVNPHVFCIGNEYVNRGGANEHFGCSLFILDTKQGTLHGISGYQYKDQPLVPKLCEEGGLDELLKKKWFEDQRTIGKVFISSFVRVGINPVLLFSKNESAKSIYDDLIKNKGTTSIKYSENKSTIDKFKSLFKRN